MALYDRIGTGYARNRRPDPRWAARIRQALGDAHTVLNIGAGAGSYEPADRAVVALEPSRAMLAQRPPGAAPAVRGVAGALPFPDDSFDVALAILTVHHWPDPAAGLAEMRRVATRQVVVSWHSDVSAERFWLTRDYLPGVAEREARSLAAAPFVVEHLEGVQELALPVPHDCTDGFLGAYWRRPDAYLDPAVRASISGLALTPDTVLEPALSSLEADLRSGAWSRRYADLLTLDELDLGYCMLVGSRHPAGSARDLRAAAIAANSARQLTGLCATAHRPDARARAPGGRFSLRNKRKKKTIQPEPARGR